MNDAPKPPDLLQFLKNEERQPYHLVYVASPYWHPRATVRDHRARAALHATAELLAKGVPAFSAVAYSNNFQNHNLPPPKQGWYEYDLNYLAASSQMIVLELPGWTESTDIAIEIGFAASRSIPITHIPYPEITQLLTPEAIQILESYNDPPGRQPDPLNPDPAAAAPTQDSVNDTILVECEVETDRPAEPTEPPEANPEELETQLSF